MPLISAADSAEVHTAVETVPVVETVLVAETAPVAETALVAETDPVAETAPAADWAAAVPATASEVAEIVEAGHSRSLTGVGNYTAAETERLEAAIDTPVAANCILAGRGANSSDLQFGSWDNLVNKPD